MSNPTDEQNVEELAMRFRSGDERAFDDLVRACRSRVFNLVFRILNSHDDANELTQEVFLKVYRHISSFRGRSAFSTWMYSLAVNTCRNRLRKKRRIALFEARSLDEPAVEGFAPTQARDPDPIPSEAAQASEIGRAVERFVAALPMEFKPAVVMRDMQGMAYEDIAAALGCSLGTVKSKISRGRGLLRGQLEPYLRS